MSKALTYERIRDYINGEEGNGCELLTTKEEFKEEKMRQEKANWNVKLKVQCKCGNSFLCDWNAFTCANKRQCPNCGHKMVGQYTKHNYDEVKNNIKSVEGYKLLSEEYIGCDEKLKIQCPQGHEFEMSYQQFFNRGCRCPTCENEKLRLKYQTPIEDIYKYINDENYEFIKWIDEYKNAKSKFKLQCLKGHEFITNYDKFKRGNRCPICAESKGEQFIRHYCENNNINFNPQYIFNDLKDKDFLRFDFAIFGDKKKTKLKYLIEYDGIFHYEKRYNDDNFEILKYHDQLKNNYCIENDISLLRIPYWEYENVEEILKDVIINNNKYNKFFIHNNIK